MSSKEFTTHSVLERLGKGKESNIIFWLEVVLGTVKRGNFVFLGPNSQIWYLNFLFLQNQSTSNLLNGSFMKDNEEHNEPIRCYFECVQ